ncbi:hypothetical protein EPO44_09960 [bacterium]|nr:MAG: hypothetical protein EPO44_09960 [bacterium]
MKRFRWIFGALVLISLLGAAAPLRAQVINFDMTMVGVSRPLTGEMFDFTATGTGTWEPVTGAFNFALVTSVGVPFNGTGTLGFNPITGLAFGTTTVEGLGSGVAVIDGAIDPANMSFTGTIVAGIPDRLGPAPFGFVHTTGTVTATMAP